MLKEEINDGYSSWCSFLSYRSKLAIFGSYVMIKYTMIITALLLGGCAEQAAYLRGEQPTAQQLQANREYFNYMAQQRQQQPQPYFIPQSGSTTNCYGIGDSVSCRTSPDARVDTSMYRR